MWQVVPHARIHGFRLLWPAISGAGCVRDGKKPAVVCACLDNKDIYLQGVYGTMGLEPATSGVKGR